VYGSGGPGGVIKSTDGAATWSAANAGLPLGSQVAVDEGPGTVYAVAEGVAVKSTDADETWTSIARVPRSLYAVLTVAPTTPATLFANTDEGLFASRDGGDSWAAVDLPGDATPLRLAVSPANPSTVYALASRQLRDNALIRPQSVATVGKRVGVGVEGVGVGVRDGAGIECRRHTHRARGQEQTPHQIAPSSVACAVPDPARLSCADLRPVVLIEVQQGSSIVTFRRASFLFAHSRRGVAG
jgi:hypothetical protein